MFFRLLGPLEVSDGEGPVHLGEGRQRAVLVLLLLHRNEPVFSDRLIDALWGETPPPTAAKILQNNVRTLRRALGDPEGRRLQTRGHAYALSVDDGELDVDRFERLVREGAAALAHDRPADASTRLRDALALWRGPALADLTYEAFAQPEIARLEEARTDALERRIDADLALGRHADVVAELDGLIAQHPLREHLRAQRILALYRCGRQAEALEAFRETRRMLIDQIGVEPGAELRGLHEAILRQDARLDLTPPTFPPELEGADRPPIVGRDRELEWLRDRWEDARHGTGKLVTATGESGAGKTRLAAELAREVHRQGGDVLYVAAGATRDALTAGLKRARDATRPTLLVVDDADATDGALDALGALPGSIETAPVLAVVTGEHLGSLAASEGVALGPLDREAVRRIALLYGPEGAPGGVPVDALCEASGGVAGRVHDAAADWARRGARRRVVTSAPRAAAGRSALRTAEAELVRNVVELQVARERVERFAGGGASVVCPFKGLASFDVADAEYFFGRERLVAELVARAVGAPLLGVVGPSGSGKSSVVKAGLVPALADGVLPGSEEWRQVLIRPGEHPLRQLSNYDAELRGEERVVLVVDQFEEVFTECRDEGERAAFADALVRLGRWRDGLVVVALRADFYGRCARYPALARALGSNHVLVGPMERDELRRAIALPAQRAGLELEPRLVDALLADVEREPGGLPLLSTALLELWQRSDGRALRLATYEATGGVRGAVARLAEDAFGRLEPPERTIARTVMLRLAGEGSGGAVVRRRVALSELESNGDERVARVLEVLTERRLLTMSTSAVEVAHEALLREWPRLRGWLDEDAQGRRTHRRLTDAARDWDERGRDPTELYRGARLAVALEWRSSHEPELNSAERAFLDASRVAAGRAQQRLRLALAGVAALLALAVLGGVVALHQRGEARNQARVAEAQRVSVQALAEPALDRALLFARQGVALADSLANRGNLLAVLLRNPAAIGVVRGAGDPLRVIDLAPDGRTLVIGDSHGTVEYLNAVTHRRIGAPYKAGGEIRALRFSRDGTRVAVSGYEVARFAGSGFVDLLDVRRHRSVRRPLASLTSAIAYIGGVAFSPDSRVVTAEFVPFPQVAFQHYVGRWDARSGRSLGPPRPVAPGDNGIRALGGFVAADRLVSSSAAGDSTVIRDFGAAMRPLRRFPGGGVPADVSPDGRLMVLVGRERTAHVLDLRTGLSRRLGGAGDAAIAAVHFTRDSLGLVTAGRDGRLTVWNARRVTPVRSVGPLAGTVRDFTLSADGGTAYTAAEDGSVIAWDLTGRRGMSRPFGAGSRAAADLAAVPGADAVAVASRSGDVYLVDGRTLRRTGRIAPAPPAGGRRTAGATQIAMAPDGRTLAIGDAEGAVRFADVRTGRPLGPPEPAHVRAVVAMAFSRDGRRLVTGGEDHAIYVWDVRRRTTSGPPYVGLVERPTSLSVSPDGTKVIATVVNRDGTGELNILSLPRLRLLAQQRAAPGRQTQFSRDGRRLFYGDAAGQVWTLDARTWRPVRRPLRGRGGPGRFALSPDDRLVATSASDGSTQLWDVASGRPIGTPLPGVPGGPSRAAFVAGGTGLVTIGRDGRGNLWDLGPKSWARRACAIAGRTLSRSEWHDVLPERSYAPACRQ